MTPTVLTRSRFVCSVSGGLLLALATNARAQNFGLPANVNLGIGAAPNAITGVAAGDVNDDGFGDFVGVDNASPANVGLALGTAAPGVYAVQAVVISPSPTGGSLPALGDFDLDGNLDLAFAGTSAGAPAVHVMRGVPGGGGAFAFAAAATVAVAAPGNAVTGLSVTDFNLDTNQDLLASVIGPNRRIATIPGMGGLTFGPLGTTTTASGASDIDVCVDFNKDGRKDLVVCGTTQGGQSMVEVYPGTTTPPTFLGPPILLQLPVGTEPIDVHWIDCNSDKFYDLAIAFAGPANGIAISRNLGAAPFFTPATTSTPLPIVNIPNSLMRFDADADGEEDLAVFSISAAGVSIKPTTFQIVKVIDCGLTPSLVTSTGNFSTSSVATNVAGLLAAQDQDFDGRLDVLAVNQIVAGPSIVQVFRNVQPISFSVSPLKPLLADLTPITLRVNAGPPFANRPFLVMFGTNGSKPGVAVGSGLVFPVNPPFLPFVLSGVLDSSGQATLTTPPVAFSAAPTAFSLHVNTAAMVAGTSPGGIGLTTNPEIITLQ